MGTDTGLIRVYNVDSKSIVQEFIMDDKYPWINHISSSPVEPIFVCAGSSNKMNTTATKSSGALVAWSMKTMSACVSFCFYFVSLFYIDLFIIRVHSKWIIKKM